MVLKDLWNMFFSKPKAEEGPFIIIVDRGAFPEYYCGEKMKSMNIESAFQYPTRIEAEDHLVTAQALYYAAYRYEPQVVSLYEYVGPKNRAYADYLVQNWKSVKPYSEMVAPGSDLIDWVSRASAGGTPNPYHITAEAIGAYSGQEPNRG